MHTDPISSLTPFLDLIAQIDSHRSRQVSELVTDVADLVLAHSKGNMNDDVCMIAIRVRSAAA